MTTTYRYVYASPAHCYTVDVTADDVDASAAMADADRLALESMERGMASAIGESYVGYRLRGVEISPAQRDAYGVALVDSGANG
jgi:hypothetical protein